MTAPRFTDDQLISLYVDENLSGPEIADRLGIGKSTVYNRLRAAGIGVRPPVRPRGAALNRETLSELYAHRKLGSTAIAEQLGVSESLVQRRLREYGIPVRPSGRSHAKNPMLTEDNLRRLYEVEERPLGEIAEIAGCSTVTVWKYLALRGITPRTRHHVQRLRNQVEPGTITARRVDDDGYVIVSVWTGKFTRRVAEHRYVMEQAIGRELEPDETVHHKDNRRRDWNDLENLQLRRGPHGRGGIFQCRDCGSHNVQAVDLPD